MATSAHVALYRRNPTTGNVEFMVLLTNKGKWMPPGGLIESEHTLKETALNELEEETGQNWYDWKKEERRAAPGYLTDLGQSNKAQLFMAPMNETLAKSPAKKKIDACMKHAKHYEREVFGWGWASFTRGRWTVVRKLQSTKYPGPRLDSKNPVFRGGALRILNRAFRSLSATKTGKGLPYKPYKGIFNLWRCFGLYASMQPVDYCTNDLKSAAEEHGASRLELAG